MSHGFAGQFAPAFLREDGRRTATDNERVVMALLHRTGTASRADLARATGLTAQSITRLVDPLIDRGLLVEGAPQIAGRGKPSAKLRLNADAAFAVGVSVMTDAVSLVLMDMTGAIRARADARLLSVDFARAAAQIASLVDATVIKAALDPARRIGIGVGVTGYFIGDGARLNPPPQLDPWALIPIDTMLAERLGGPVWVDNDGNVAAVGEAMLGAGRITSDFAYLYFAVGFGGGVIAGGAQLRGSHGNAGEFASVLPKGWPQPNLENLRLYLAAQGQPYDDLHAMLATFDSADPLIDGWLDICTPSFNLVASVISATLDPDLIVLGGRLPPVLAERIIARIRLTNPERRGHHRPAPRIVPSTIGPDAAAIGAAMLPLRTAFFA
ncbi:ROK family transcriptional regulator [Sphingomonas sanguinis]|jgi:predicted NBD/HSP70 family sugar kinase|uniref:ROK family transcriptional regulator n=2 Tax=Sphingomonas sanguinis TaxID=33051 RepID=A0A7Y7UPS1_9SPHN|nr:ROK family transcriptional regulator [Sphingomonas sanguinis]MBZ6381270.1 ROK family transcriptional regulator [Sphingomonas sanguinis]NNG50175.1 ROK family transcriptional regulator [Sphingomonas sanguinis]NNG55076.1 ROK family transcriptional regulator [Sphingomonas sanguinis]NVP30572.1 ROK family transcriptional regulator [Sphingomonas sanguinis]